MAEIDTNYQLKQGESPEAYSSRVAAYNASKNGGSSTQSAPDNSFMQQLQQKLLGQSEIISSENTNLESKINEAIGGIREGQEASAQAITSQFDREIGYAQDQGESRFTSALEAQRGFATNTAALKQLAQDTDKQVRDLEQRKQELILQGQAAAAGQISQLQLQAIQFHQQAQQQVFSNLLSMGNFAQQQQQNQLAQRAQTFQEDNAKANIALEYGIQVNPGDTIQDVINRAKPFASKEQKLKLEQMETEIANNRAQTARAYADIKAGAAVTDPTSIDLLARGALTSGGANLALIKDPITYSKVVNRTKTMQEEDVRQAVADFKSEGVNKAGARNAARQQYSDNPQLLAIANDEIEKQYGDSGSDISSSPFKAPGTASQFINAKPLPPASPEAVRALQNALLGTGFGFAR